MGTPPRVTKKASTLNCLLVCKSGNSLIPNPEWNIEYIVQALTRGLVAEA